MRLLPRIGRINSKREVWPGGPQLGQVIEAQLNPPPGTPAAATQADEWADEAPEDTTARDLLLLLR